ncbi:MAG TPA: thiamine pyrophosphate-dependent enzyme, partial [Gemmatimonadaceae bacterium]|nr:thiamine pyrophosphate-dependent enzyme [Gemmatimonadaceae bacterium]
MAAPASSRKRSTSPADAEPPFPWREIARTALVSRALDDLEEATNRNRANVPRDQLILYQFSARGHEVAQAILASLVTHRHDGVSAYYRNRPLLLGIGLTIEDGLASPLGRSGGFSDGRDIGVVCNLPNPNGPIVLPMGGDVGSQFTPCAGWAQAITYHRDVLGDDAYTGAMGVVLGGDGSVATNGFWSSLTIATTLKLPMLFYIEDNGLGISVRGDLQTPGGDITKNLASFGNLFLRDGDGTDPAESAALLAECVAHVRSGQGPAMIRLTVPRLCSHSGPDNQKGYRTEAEIAADEQRDPMPKLKKFLVPFHLTAADWKELEAEVERDVATALAAARARPAPDPATVGRYVYADDSDGS